MLVITGYVQAEQPYPDANLAQSFIQQQLISIFIKGLQDDSIARRVSPCKLTMLAEAIHEACKELLANKAFNIVRGIRDVEPM